MSFSSLNYTFLHLHCREWSGRCWLAAKEVLDPLSGSCLRYTLYCYLSLATINTRLTALTCTILQRDITGMTMDVVISKYFDEFALLLQSVFTCFLHISCSHTGKCHIWFDMFIKLDLSQVGVADEDIFPSSIKYRRTIIVSSMNW